MYVSFGLHKFDVRKGYNELKVKIHQKERCKAMLTANTHTQHRKILPMKGTDRIKIGFPKDDKDM